MSISVGGLMSGMDTNGMISQLLEVQRQPILQMQKKEANYQVELSAYGNLQSTLNSLKSALDGLDSEKDLTSFSAVSGDTDLFNVSADDTAVAGSYSITVTQMAEKHKLSSVAFTDEEAVGEGTIHLKVGNGSAIDISVSDTDTIDDISQAINDADAGVQAAVIYDGTDYFLSLTADETGEENTINLTVTDSDGDNTDLNGLSRLVYDAGVTERMTQSQAAADSIITVDGVSDIHRTTDTIDDVIDGLTINLKSAPAGPDDNETTLTVERNRATIASKINSFVSAYNTTVDFFDQFQSYSPDNDAAGILLGDATTNSIRNRIRNIVSATTPGNESFQRLTDLGITMNDAGKLNVDSSTLNTALDDNFDDAVRFFADSSTTDSANGFAVQMINILDSMLDSNNGSLEIRTDGIQDSIEDIHENIENMERRLSSWEMRTRAQFQSLELLIGQYQATGEYLGQQIAGMQNLNNFIANR